MKWKAAPIPRQGDDRRRTFFAFAPRRCTDGYYRWMCRLVLVETYCCSGCGWYFASYEPLPAQAPDLRPLMREGSLVSPLPPIPGPFLMFRREPPPVVVND